MRVPEVEADFSEYETIDETLEGEEYLEDLGKGLLDKMVDGYEPNNSPIDRYKVKFDGEVGSFTYSVASEKFFGEFDDEDEMQLRSVDEVYSETFGEEEYQKLSN